MAPAAGSGCSDAGRDTVDLDGKVFGLRRDVAGDALHEAEMCQRFGHFGRNDAAWHDFAAQAGRDLMQLRSLIKACRAGEHEGDHHDAESKTEPCADAQPGEKGPGAPEPLREVSFMTCKKFVTGQRGSKSQPLLSGVAAPPTPREFG